MDDNQSILLRNAKNGNRRGVGVNPKMERVPELERVEKTGVTMFQEKLAATIGPSYVSAFFVGGLLGMT